MGSTGVIKVGEGPRTVDYRIQGAFRDNTDYVDTRRYMSGERFSSASALRRTIDTAAGGRFDILDFNDNGSSGYIMYTDADSSDGIAYDVHWQRDYSVTGSSTAIVITEFNELEEGEW